MSSLLDNFSEAESYECSSSLERTDGLQLINIIAPKRGSKILDLGCGTGYHSKVLADLVGPDGKVVGIDPDTERLQLAKGKYSASNIEYLERSAGNIPGGDYDLVFSNHVLHWCNDKNLVFTQVASKLKTGGIFSFKCVMTHPLPIELFSDEVKKALTFSTINEEVIKILAISCGFTEVMMNDQEECIHEFDSIYALVKFIMIHTHGKFEETHFNIPALMKHYGSDKVVFKCPVLTAILSKK